MAVKLYVKKKLYWWEIAIFALVAVSLFAVRAPYLNEPFESDQANYSYISQHWGDGSRPYRNAWDNKPPLVYIFYRLISAFLGSSPFGIHLGFAILALGTTLFIYQLCRRLFSRGFALAAVFMYALFSAGARISGTFGVPENLAVFFISGGMFYFWNGREKEKNKYFFFSGLFLGFAMMSKQVAFWEFFALTVFIIVTGLRSTTFLLNALRLILYWLGAALSILLFMALFILFGAELEFLNSVIVYNLFFGGIVGIRQGCVNFLQALQWSPSENAVLWVYAVCGLILAGSKKDRKGLFLGLWFVSSLLAAASALRFFPHYFIQVIPILVILAVYFLQEVWDSGGSRRKSAAVILLMAMTALFFISQFDWWFKYSSMDSLIKRRGNLARPSLYRDAEAVGYYIKIRTDQRDPVYVWGLWPEVYYYSQRKSPSKYFYISSRGTLVGRFREVVQTQVYYDMLRNPPKYIVIDEHFDDLISPSMQRYINTSFALVKAGEGYRVLRRKERGY